MQQPQSTTTRKTNRPGEYPNAKLLGREQKVKDRKDKEIRRAGTKYKIDTKTEIREANISG